MKHYLLTKIPKNTRQTVSLFVQFRFNSFKFYFLIACSRMN